MAKRSKKTVKTLELETEPVEKQEEEREIVSTFLSADKSKKAVIYRNAVNENGNAYEIVFLEKNKVMKTESHAYHTRGFHESIAQEYVNS